jgi:hypothetical protein
MAAGPIGAGLIEQTLADIFLPRQLTASTFCILHDQRQPRWSFLPANSESVTLNKPAFQFCSILFSAALVAAL